MNSSKVICLTGVPGCGKSTLAMRMMHEMAGPWLRINWDERRSRPDQSNAEEVAMKARAMKEAADFLKAGGSVIADNTHMTPKSRTPWEQLAKTAGACYQLISVNTPIEECIARDRTRTARVGRAVIERMALRAGMLAWPIDRKLVLVDMDGTTADCEHRRRFLDCTPKDYDSFFAGCADDPPIDHIVKWVKAIAESPEYAVVIVSGRPTDRAGIATEEWLERHGINCLRLLMRDRGDRRPDWIVKQQILDYLPKDRIAFVIDDRNSVVDMWRRNGLTVYQVADGDF